MRHRFDHDRPGDRRREGGREFAYRIEVEQPRPSLTLFLPGPVRTAARPSAGSWGTALPSSAAIRSASALASGERTSTDLSELRSMNSCVVESAISFPLPITIWSVNGTSLLGGIGGIVSTLFGVLVAGVLNNLMVLLGVNIYIEQIVQGAIILLFVFFFIRFQRR